MYFKSEVQYRTCSALRKNHALGRIKIARVWSDSLIDPDKMKLILDAIITRSLILEMSCCE
jgi:hypothetical protein